MTMTLSLAGRLATRVLLSVPAAGVWIADVDLDDAADLSGSVELVVGSSTWRGTIDPDATGTFGVKTVARVVGGAAGWRKTTKPRHFHNDAGLKISTVVEALASQLGETVSGAPTDRLGVDYVLGASSGAGALANLCPVWWVDAAGVTRIASSRDPYEVASPYDLLDFDPRSGVATLACDTPEAIDVGATIRDRLDAPAVVRSYEIEAKPGSLRIRAWTDGLTAETRLLRALRAIVQRVVASHSYHALVRYRVVQTAGGRSELQIVRSRSGFPDTLPISYQPGSPGSSGTPAPGAVVLVSFVEGDPTLPVITHCARTDDAAFVPLSSALDASGTVRVGEHADLVELGSGSETLSALAAHGRVVRYGDPIAGLTAGATVELTGTGPVSKVSA